MRKALVIETHRLMRTGTRDFFGVVIDKRWHKKLSIVNGEGGATPESMEVSFGKRRSIFKSNVSEVQNRACTEEVEVLQLNTHFVDLVLESERRGFLVNNNVAWEDVMTRPEEAVTGESDNVKDVRDNIGTVLTSTGELTLHSWTKTWSRSRPRVQFQPWAKPERQHNRMGMMHLQGVQQALRKWAQHQRLNVRTRACHQ